MHKKIRLFFWILLIIFAASAAAGWIRYGYMLQHSEQGSPAKQETNVLTAERTVVCVYEPIVLADAVYAKKQALLSALPDRRQFVVFDEP